MKTAAVNTIELENVVSERKLTIITVILAGLISVIVGFVSIYYVLHFAAKANGWMEVKLDTAKTYVSQLFSHDKDVVIKEIDPNGKDIEIILKDEAERSGVPFNLIRALADVESSRGKALYRFEPDVYARFSGKAPSDSERRMLSSSFGVLHVMGFNAKRCGVTYDKLFQPVVGVACGVSLLKDCLREHHGKLKAALNCYNHDPEYPGRVGLALLEGMETDVKVKG